MTAIKILCFLALVVALRPGGDGIVHLRAIKSAYGFTQKGVRACPKGLPRIHPASLARTFVNLTNNAFYVTKTRMSAVSTLEPHFVILNTKSHAC